ncbi:MAG: adenylate/guanylate cyclase domain-containing protein, partial [Actinomycetota bacterium]
MSDEEQLRAAIEAQESLRGSVDDAIVDVAVAALRQRLGAVTGSAATKRRRLVTVLFADVSGSTALAERLHVEDFSDRFDRLWEAVDAVIERHGGRIDKHIGDGVMALWGTDVSADDDAERAIRAALEMQRTVVESGSDIGADGLQLRIGINTGPVVLGAIASTDEINVMGDTVNVAARLESKAPVGGVLAGHDTYRHVRGVFTVSQQEPLHVKGKRDALRTYLIEGVRPRAFHLPGRDIEGVEARMVGRDDEFARLTDALRRTVESGSNPRISPI